MPKIVQIGMGGSDVAAPPTELTTNLDPALLFEDGTTGEDFIKVDTTTDANKLVLLGTFTEADNESSGFAGIREGTPKAPLHIVGTGGSTGMSLDPTQDYSATVFIENSTGNSKNRCLMVLNGDGGSGSAIDLHHTDTRRLGLGGFGSAATVFSETVPLQLTASAGSGQYINFTTGGTESLKIDNDGKLATGAEATPLCAASGGVHIRTGTGSTLGSAHASADDLVVEGATHTGMTFITGGTTSNTYIMFADDGDNAAGAIYYGHSNNRLELKAGGTFISTFTSGGQVNGAELTADYLFQAQDGEVGIVANTADANGQSLVFTKSRNATDGSHTIVNDDDVLGEIEFKGSDGNSFELGAKIFARVDGTPSEGSDMPSELVFATSADGSATPSERLNISSTGVAKFAGNVEVEKDSPVLILDNSTAGDNFGDRSSTIQFNGVATRGSGTATTLGSMRYQHLGSGTGNRAEWVVSVNNSGDSGTTDTLTERLRILGDSGKMKLSGAFLTSDGDAGNPGHSFTDSENTGMFHDGANGVGLSSNGTMGLLLDSGNKLFTNGNSTTAGVASGGLQIQTGANSLANVNSSFNDLIIEGDGPIGMTFLANANSGIRFQKDANNDHHGITFDSGTSSIRTRLGSTDRFYVDDAGRVKLLYASLQFFSGLGADDATSEPLYLDPTDNATLVIDVRKGNYGDVTLTTDVTAIKFFHAPNDGNVYTMTAKIKQHASSAKTIDYSDSAVTVFWDAGSTSVTGEMKFSGGVHHTMSTTTGAVDIVQFTIFPNGSTFDVFASVIGQNFS